MLPVSQAEQIILDLVRPFCLASDRQLIPLIDSVGRILAETPKSNLDFPHWHNSAMDGYAVRYQDLQNCSSAQPVTLTVVDEIPAGKIAQVTIQQNQAVRIFTGAMLPPGADTVIMQEDTSLAGDRVTILATPTPQQFVRHRGDFYQAGQPLLKCGTVIGAAEMAILAAAQCEQISVYRRPRVAIFSTGDELIPIEQTLSPGQIVDSNHYALSTFCVSAGATVINLGIVKDNKTELQEIVSQALKSADVIISSGGVSVGDYDLVDQILTELGGEIHIRSVAIKPGKPLTFATFSSTKENQNPILYFGLPGNPVSALVSCWRFVSPALQKLSGLMPSQVGVKILRCKTNADLEGAGKRETYIWGSLEIINGSFEFTPAQGLQISGNLIGLADVNALAIATLGEKLIPKDSLVEVLLINKI
jgi:molybdopterin molybdotransferase